MSAIYELAGRFFSVVFFCIFWVLFGGFLLLLNHEPLPNLACLELLFLLEAQLEARLLQMGMAQQLLQAAFGFF